MKFKHLIDNIAINYIFYENFASMEDIRKKCNLIVELWKFITNKKIIILSKVVVLDYNQVYSQIFFYLTFIYVWKSKNTTKEIWMQECNAWEFFIYYYNLKLVKFIWESIFKINK